MGAIRTLLYLLPLPWIHAGLPVHCRRHHLVLRIHWGGTILQKMCRFAAVEPFTRATAQVPILRSHPLSDVIIPSYPFSLPVLHARVL